MKIGIIGMGFVGKILKRYYKNAKTYTTGDPKRKLKQVLNCDVIIIAINLEHNGKEDYNKLEEIVEQAPPGRAFVIKSTTAPGVTQKLINQFPQHEFIVWPEFLTEATAWTDFTNPQLNVISTWLKHLEMPQAPRHVCGPTEAEIIKHATNTFYAFKVIFFNMIYDLCNEKGANYEAVRSALTRNKWIGDSHSHPHHKGYRGYGGKCLPKDVRAFIRTMPEEYRYFFSKMEQINENLTKTKDRH